MNLESLVDTYGYLAVLVGTFFEGETILVLGGFAAHRGYLHLPWVILAAFIGTLCGDQLFFLLGRRHSQAILAKRPSWRRRIEKVHQLLQRFGTPIIPVFRFLYGLRSVPPFVIGMSPFPTAKFVFLNALGHCSGRLWLERAGVSLEMPWRLSLEMSNVMSYRFS